MEINIRLAQTIDYEDVSRIIDQVQQMHVDWRPDIYKPNDNLLPKDVFEEAVNNNMYYVAETEGKTVGVMEIMYRHIEAPALVNRNVIFIDTMAVDEIYRGKGVGHKFFEMVKALKTEKCLDGIELQVNIKNASAITMYEKCGFTIKTINMELLDK